MSERILHELVQGSPEWHAFRAEHDGASEAAAMLGLSKYATRNELLRQKATGIATEVDEAKQGLFDAGHASEAAARPLAEEILVDELYPATYSLGRLSASTDGLTMDGATAFEHKLWNADLAAAIERGELPDAYMPQCQQIMLVTGAEQVLFMVSDGTHEHCAHMFVRPDTKWQQRIVVGWAQFAEDLANYQPVEVIPAAVAAPTMALPALSVQVRGEIQVIDNLAVFGERLNAFIDGLDKNPSDDQAFADAEAAIKTLGTAETALEAAKSSALAQVATVDEMTRTVALYAGQARQTRLMLEKLVKSRKEQIRIEIVQEAKDKLAAHVARLTKRLGKPYLPALQADFAGAIKGKKTVKSLHDAVDGLLAQSKIALNESADKIQANLETLRELAADYAFLFSDTAQLVLRDNETVVLMVKARIAEHKEAEAKRIEAEAEKARERIRAEEQAKLAREQEERERAEAARLAKEQAAARGNSLSAASIPMTNLESTSRRNGEADDPPAAGPKSGKGNGDVSGTATPAPAAARPTNVQIIGAVAIAFGVDEETAYGWILEAFTDERRAA